MDRLEGDLAQKVEGASVAALLVCDEEDEALVEGVAAKGGDPHVDEEAVQRGDRQIADAFDVEERAAYYARLRGTRCG